jgi:hypothetical protein
MPEPSEPTLREPWLVAAWPGMGSVALAAASYIVAKLGGTPIQTIVQPEYFDITTVQIEGGVVARPALPKSTIHAVPGGARAGPDLLVFTGEAQPTQRGYDFCRVLLDFAESRGVKRIVTFAAMATPIHPSAPPRVFGVASDRALLPLLRRHDVAILSDGQISGLNGVLVAAAAERSIESICLLGELPFFAVGVPNPKASLAVLRAFGRIAGIAIDLAEIEEQARLVERALIEIIERAGRQQAARAGESAEEEGGEALAGAEAEPEPEGPPPAALARIEELFQLARADKARALELKAELDRLGLFAQYEDRFLDLFKREEQ